MQVERRTSGKRRESIGGGEIHPWEEGQRGKEESTKVGRLRIVTRAGLRRPGGQEAKERGHDAPLRERRSVILPCVTRITKERERM